MISLDPSYRTAIPHPEVARAWGLHQGAVVLSFWGSPQGDLPDEKREAPRIAAIPKERTQDALDRAWRKYGDGVTVLHIPERFK